MPQVAVGTQIWNYHEVGVGKGTPILIMHGWGRKGNEWIELAKALADGSGKSVYVLDLPGFGGSSLPLVESMQEYAELTAQFCAYMEIKKVVVVGHSLGGRVAILLASRYPTMVEKVILVNPAGVKPRSIKRVLLRVIAKLFGWVPRAWRQTFVGNIMDEDYRKSPDLRQLYRIVVGEDLKKYLPTIKATTVVVWGENDEILPLSLTKTYRQLLPDCQVRVVWGAGHDPHLSNYEETLAILQEVVA